MNNASSLIEIAKLWASRHDERRKYEWKVSFAFWALIIGAILNGNVSTMIKEYPHWSIAIGISIVILYAFLWLRGLWVANEKDKQQSYHYLKQAEETIKDSNHKFKDYSEKITRGTCKYWLGFFTSWAMQFHILVTAVLVATLYFFAINN